MSVPPPALADIDFAVHDLPDLHEVLEGLRQQGPAVPVLFATRPLWMILGYGPVKQVMTDEQHLSTTEAYKRTLGRTMGPVMATMSGKAHRKNRGVISAVFFPKPMRALVEPVFRVEAEKLADELAQRQQVDLVRDFTRVFRPTLRCESLLGFTPASRRRSEFALASTRESRALATSVPRVARPTPRSGTRRTSPRESRIAASRAEC